MGVPHWELGFCTQAGGVCHDHGPTTITLGHDNNKAEDEASTTDVAGHEFGWDNHTGNCQVLEDPMLMTTH
ncbi:hypothetical protein DFH08DRAFT_1088489 [Mycena albidolilacea]|uniref:Uncharacterized protein n=1 Tax=Mycena albidolilacea TaxID=1033008 RepID=A0AAD6Z5T7_9AGAR|nr:hypothetical protein DFH08DRAFT_1088489 [Mycena albidolilacea]